MTGKTILVTGAAGFLGSHLCDYLLAQDHRVICVDNLDTGSLQNIEHIRNGEDFLYVFYNRESGDYILLSYNLISRSLETPIIRQ